TAATPLSWLSLALGFGLGTTLQALPSQCSTSVTTGPVRPTPAAHISLLDSAATALRLLWLPGLGLGTTLHALPSQCSTSVWKSEAWRFSPSAHTLPLDTALTAKNLLYTSGFGLGITFHALPSQCSTSVWNVGELEKPTAHISLLDIAATPLSW